MAGSPRFKPSFCNLFPICRFESPWRTLFGLFDSPRVGIILHMRECVKCIIFILNPNCTRLNF